MEATITIYSIAGEAIATAIVTQEAVIHEELMTSDYVKLSWSSPTGDTLPAGAYIEHDGERYSLLEPYAPQAESGGEYRYEPEFQSRVMAWGKQVLPLYTYEEDGKTVKTREMDWDFTGSPADAMYMVEQAIRNETGEEWQVELSDSLPATITISSQSGSILSALNEIADACETEWWADKATDTLYLSRCQRGEPVTLTAGGNVGVPSVTEAKDGYYTRFYVFGSTRNVTQDSGSAATNSVVNKRLTLDPATYPGGYIDAREGLLPGEIFTAILTYDDIYPSSRLEIGDVRARLKYRLDSSGEKIETGADDEGNPVYEQYAIWYFQIPGLDFDPDTIIPQKTLSVHFESGQLAGRDFELAYHEKASQVKDAADVAAFQVKAGDYEIIIDESEGMILPGLAYIIPQDGDKATLYNIEMPAEYTSAAQADLAERALKDIARRVADNRSYEMDSNPVAFKEDGTELSVGQAVSYAYLGVTLETRVLMVERHLDFPWQATIRVGNELIKGNTQQLKEEVTQASQNIDVLKAFNELSVSLSNSYANAMREMQEGFARIGNMWRVDPDRENTIYSNFNAYVKGWLSAKGANDTQGEGGGGGGLSYSRLDSWEGYTDEEKGGWVLSAYLGVRLHQDIENLKSGVAMSYAVTGTGNAITDVTRDGSRWVFTKGKAFSELGHLHKLSDISDLHASWDAVLKAAPAESVTRWPSWGEVTGKPTTFTPSSHKHVKADITDFPTTWAWSAISGKPSSFTPSEHTHPLADISDLHSSWDAILKVAPTAYVTRWPSWGEVTGKPSTFTPSSHTHTIAQVTGLQSALDAKLNAAVFEELFEKVTLSSGETAIRAKFGLYSDKWVSAKGANPNQGEGGGFAYTRLDTWEGYDSATMDGWVLSAKLGYSLYNDVKSLKAGAAVSFTIQGTGNAITDVSKSGTALVFTRGTTFALASHSHPLSDISDLNSGWNSLLKAAPSSYVTRWPSWSEVSGKPTTFTPASHTHTISQVSDLHASWDAILKAAPSGYVTRWPSIGEVTGKQSLAIKLNGGGTEGTSLFTYNGTAAKTVNITAASIGAPTKTGSGASGTWGISISGSAALAGFLNKNTAFNYSGQAGLQYYDAEMQSTANGNAWSGPSKGWHQILHMPLSVANYFTEIALPVNDVNGLAWRQRRGNSYYGWYRLLDSANYTSYTVTKTGGGASGTWGIGISGNAATASKWAAKRTISLTGAVTGSVSLDGSGNVSLATTYAAANISALDSRYVNVSGDTMTGTLTLSSGSAHKGAKVGNVYVNAIDRALIIQNAKEIRFGQSDNWAYNDWGGLTYDHSKKYLYLGIADGTIFQQNAGALSGGSLLTPGIGNIFVGNNTSNKVWHAGNDGSGSGLDADLLDGTHKSGLFTAFSANGNSTRITIGGVTKDLTVPYASNADKLDGLQATSFMRCDGANGIALTGGNGNTEGYRLVIQKTMTGWSINNLVFVVASRHNGQGILSVAFHITADSPSSYGYSIRYFGANLALRTPFRAFYNTSTHVFRLYWHYSDYTSTAINVLRVEGFPSPSNGTWYEAMPSDNGTELTIEYNNADTIGGTSKGGLLTALSSSSGTNLSLTVGGTTKTVADLYATAAEKLLTARTINGTSFNGTANIVTSYWGTARNIAIASSNGGGAGAATSVNGSANVTLKLPATITAALSGNASSASKLQTARTLWGQSFNGSGNVSGNMTGVGSISASGNFSSSKATNTYLAGNQGQALVNSTASAGAYVMLHRGCSTNGYFTLGTYQGTYLLQYTAKSTVTAGNNSVTKSLTLLNEAGNSSFPGSLYAKTGLYSDGYVSAKGQNTSSDMRLKDVLGSVTLPLERIANAPSFEFRWRDGSGESAGSSAQYWREVLPSAVRERGGYLEMQYGNIALLSAVAIARETLRIATMVSDHERRIRELERENAELRKRLYA